MIVCSRGCQVLGRILGATVKAIFDGEGDVSVATDVLRPWAERTGGELRRIDEGDAPPGLVLESCAERRTGGLGISGCVTGLPSIHSAP